jgi:hypothetical protein
MKTFEQMVFAAKPVMMGAALVSGQPAAATAARKTAAAQITVRLPRSFMRLHAAYDPLHMPTIASA